jgi:hypothetical protein
VRAAAQVDVDDEELGRGEAEGQRPPRQVDGRADRREVVQMRQRRRGGGGDGGDEHPDGGRPLRDAQQAAGTLRCEGEVAHGA